MHVILKLESSPILLLRVSITLVMKGLAHAACGGSLPCILELTVVHLCLQQHFDGGASCRPQYLKLAQVVPH